LVVAARIVPGNRKLKITASIQIEARLILKEPGIKFKRGGREVCSKEGAAFLKKQIGLDGECPPRSGKLAGMNHDLRGTSNIQHAL
jgi:hypothetical protein